MSVVITRCYDWQKDLTPTRKEGKFLRMDAKDPQMLPSARSPQSARKCPSGHRAGWHQRLRRIPPGVSGSSLWHPLDPPCLSRDGLGACLVPGYRRFPMHHPPISSAPPRPPKSLLRSSLTKPKYSGRVNWAELVFFLSLSNVSCIWDRTKQMLIPPTTVMTWRNIRRKCID